MIAFVLGVNATAAEGWRPDRDQRAWLAKHPVIQVDVDRELHPFSFSDDSGIARGVMVDLCTELSKRLGITLQVTPRHYPEIAERMDAGVVEVAAGMNLQDLRDPDSYRKTRTVISVPWGVFGRSDEPPIDRLQDLAGRTVVVYAGIDTTTRHFDGLEGCTFVEAPTVLDAVAMVLDGRADAYYDVYVTVDYHLQRALIAGLKPLLVSESRVDSGFVVHRDLAPLIPILHHALDDLADEEIPAIHRKWKLFVTGSRQSTPALSADQRSWLAEHPVIRVGADRAWAPFEFQDQYGRYQGMAVDVCEVLGRQLGVRFDFVTDAPWSQVLAAAEAREVDILSCLVRSPERERYLRFTRPYLSFPMVIYARDNAGLFGDLHTLAGERVAVEDSYITADLLARDHPGIHLVHCRDTDEALSQLAAGHVRAYVGNIVSTSDAIRRTGQQGLRVAGETPYRFELAIGIRRDWPQLHAILDQALAELPPRELQEIRSRWIGQTAAEAIDLTWVWRIAVLLTVGLALVVAWNRRLSREVSRSERALDAQRQAEAAHRSAAEQALAASRAKSTFLTNVSHEIRTPMNAVMGYSQLLLRREDLSPQARNQLQAIARSGSHLMALIDDVLEMAKIEAGRVVIKHQVFEPRQLAIDLETMFQHHALQRRLQLEVTVDSELPPALVGDVAKLRQILVNLVGNALKFTTQGRVSLALRAAGGRFVAEVSDTGPGIATADQVRIFEAFEQATDSHGTGLGLSISRQIARAMDGDITLTSHEQGSTFRLDLPLRPGRIPACIPKPGRVVGLDQDPPAVLVVDDNDCNREILGLLLEAIGCRVRNAASGASAIAACREALPDLVFMDLRMPGMDGPTTTRQLRALPGGEGLPVVAVTAHAMDADESSLRSAGIDILLRKPFSEEELFMLLEEHFGWRLQRMEPEEAGSGGAAGGSPAADATLVLVVEDDPDNREVARLMLSELGLRVLTAEDGATALATFEAHRPTMVITDRRMPGIDGIELASRLATYTPRPRVILASGMAAGRELPHGVDQHLAKPFGLADIAAALKHCGIELPPR